jgi:hypothetical protein
VCVSRRRRSRSRRSDRQFPVPLFLSRQARSAMPWAGCSDSLVVGPSRGSLQSALVLLPVCNSCRLVVPDRTLLNLSSVCREIWGPSASVIISVREMLVFQKASQKTPGLTVLTRPCRANHNGGQCRSMFVLFVDRSRHRAQHLEL